MSYRMVSKYTCSPEVLFKADCLLAIKWVSGSLKHWWCRHMLWLPIVCVCIYTHTVYLFCCNNFLFSLSIKTYCSLCPNECLNFNSQYYVAFVIMNYFICVTLFCHCKHRKAINIFSCKKKTNKQTDSYNLSKEMALPKHIETEWTRCS